VFTIIFHLGLEHLMKQDLVTQLNEFPFHCPFQMSPEAQFALFPHPLHLLLPPPRQYPTLQPMSRFVVFELKQVLHQTVLQYVFLHRQDFIHIFMSSSIVTNSSCSSYIHSATGWSHGLPTVYLTPLIVAMLAT